MSKRRDSQGTWRRGLRSGAVVPLLVALTACSAPGRRDLAEAEPTPPRPLSAAEKLEREAEAESSRAAAPAGASITSMAPSPPGVDPQTLVPAADPRARVELPDVLVDLVREDSERRDLEPAENPVAVDPEARRLAVSHYAKARLAALDGKYLIALHELGQARQLDPSSTSILRELSRTHLTLGNVSRATSYLEQVLAIEPGDSEALVSLGVSAADRREFRQAVVLLGRAWLSRSGGGRRADDQAADIVSAYTLSESLRHLGFERASIQAALGAVNVPPRLAARSPFGARLGLIYRQRGELWRAIGDAYCRLGEYERALGAYDRCGQLPLPDPGALRARIIYANLKLNRPYTAQYQLLNAFADAARVGDREIRLCQYLAEHAEPIDLLAEAVGDLYRQHRDQSDLARAAAALLPAEQAQQLLRDFIERRPRDVSALSHLLAWLGQRSLPAAVDLTIGLVADYPDLAADYVQRLATALPRPGEAIDVARFSSLRAPARANVEARLLAGYGALGRAWSVCGAALDEWPDDPGLLILNVDLAALLGEPRLLESALARSAGVDEVWAWVTRSYALRALGQAERAVEAAERAVALDPGDLDAVTQLAQAQLAMALAAATEDEMNRRAEQAAAAAWKAVELEPEREDAYAILFELYRRSGILADANRIRQVTRGLLEVNAESRLYSRLLAQEALGQGRHEQALDRLLNLYESDPTDVESLRLAVTAWLQLARLDDAAQWLQAQRRRRPGDPALIEQWVRLALERRQFDPAIDELQRVLEREPENGTAARLLERTLRAAGRTAEAVILADERLSERPVGVRRELGLSALYAQAQIPEKAIPHLQWIRDHAEGLELEYLQPAVTMAVGLDPSPERDAVLLELAEAALDSSTDAPLSVYGAALLALARMGELDDGRFDDLTQRAMDNARGGNDASIRGAMQWRKLAQDLTDAGHPEAAARALRRRLYAVAPLESPARSLLVLVTLAADAAAGDSAERSIELLHDLDTRGQLPVMDEEQGQLSLVEALYESSQMYSIVGDDVGADRLLREIIRLSDDDAMALNNLGYMRLETGEARDDPQVEQWIVRAHELQPDDSNILDTLGWLRYKQGRYEDEVTDEVAPPGPRGAISLIRQAIDREEQPGGELFDHLGDALYRSGDQQGAVEAWKRAVATVEDETRQERILQNLFLIQTRLWGLLVADPQQLYDRDYASLRDRARGKIEAVERGGSPAVAETFDELPPPTPSGDRESN